MTSLILFLVAGCLLLVVWVMTVADDAKRKAEIAVEEAEAATEKAKHVAADLRRAFHELEGERSRDQERFDRDWNDLRLRMSVLEGNQAVDEVARFTQKRETA